MNEEQREYQEHYSPDGEYIEYLMEHPEINSMNTKEQYGSKLNTPHEIYDSAGFFTNQFNQFTEEARVGYPWTQDGQKMIERITELRSELSDFIRETREQAKKEERDKILETLWNTPSSMIPEALQRISKQ